MTDYDSRRTGNRLLDTGSTPVWSTKIKMVEHRLNPGYCYGKRQVRCFENLSRL